MKTPRANLHGAILMILSMLGFALEDMLIKLMAGHLPTWQIITLLGIGGTSLFAGLALWQGQALFSRRWLMPALILRSLGELIGTIGFVTAIALTPLSSASAILQATPLAVTLGAALFLCEPVGWRRWSAIIVGFIGVLLILRPGLEGFNALSLFAVLGVIGLSLRDLMTRAAPSDISSLQLSFLGFAMLVPAGGILSLFSAREFVALSPALGGQVLGMVLLGALSYYAIVLAMRLGEVSYVTPFRYTRLIFALIIGFLVFDEVPDVLMLLGSGVIVASGIYTVWRERKIAPAP